MGSDREAEERREGATENRKAGRPPPRWDSPATASCQDQLPNSSQRKNLSRPCSSVGTGQSVWDPPPQVRHSAASHAFLPGHRTSGARSPRGPVPLQPQQPGHRSPPSARFQIEIPWLRPSEDSTRQPRPLEAEAPPVPLPDAPPARKPPRAAPRPQNQVTPPHGHGWLFPQDSLKGVAGYPREGSLSLRSARVTTANVCVKGVLTRESRP